MVKIICVDGCNIENKERIAAFCSEELKAAGIYEISSIGEEDQLTFCVDELILSNLQVSVHLEFWHQKILNTKKSLRMVLSSWGGISGIFSLKV